MAYTKRLITELNITKIANHINYPKSFSCIQRFCWIMCKKNRMM